MTNKKLEKKIISMQKAITWRKRKENQFTSEDFKDIGYNQAIHDILRDIVYK